MLNPNDICFCGQYGKILNFSKPNLPAVAIILKEKTQGIEYLFTIKNVDHWNNLTSEIQFNLLKGFMLTAGVRNVGNRSDYDMLVQI